MLTVIKYADRRPTACVSNGFGNRDAFGKAGNRLCTWVGEQLVKTARFCYVFYASELVMHASATDFMRLSLSNLSGIYMCESCFETVQ